MRTARHPKNGRGRNPEQTREAILKAAIAEFAREGVAGARTDEIARTAKVNKALLYYYFSDKESLYAAVLDHAFGSIYTRLTAILDSDLPCREKILRYAGEHFDALACQPQFCRLVHFEMGRLGREGSPHIRRLAERYISRLAARLQAVLHEGMTSGEFRKIDPMNFALSIPALNVFYFVSAPMIRAVTGMEPLTPERIAARKAAVLDLLAHALFSGAAEVSGRGVSSVHPADTAGPQITSQHAAGTAGRQTTSRRTGRRREKENAL